MTENRAPATGRLLPTFAIYCVWLSACFDPVGQIYGFRYFALLVAALAMATMFVQRGIFERRAVYWLYFLLFVFLLPAWGTAVALLRGGFRGPFVDTSNYAAAVYFSVSLLYGASGPQVGVRAMLLSLRALSLVVLLCFISFHFDVLTTYAGHIPEFGIAYFGTRQYGGTETYYLYFIASPMLVFLVAHSGARLAEGDLRGANVFDAVIGSLALLLSGTRMNMLLSVTILPTIYLYRRFGIAAVIGLALIALASGWILLAGDTFVIAALDATEESNARKLGYLQVYREVFSDALSVFVGQGFNAHTWSQSFRGLLDEGASKIELTYFELFRVFGVFVGAISIALLILPVLLGGQGRRQYDWMPAAVFFYLASASLNPYLFSSNGMLVLGLAIAALAPPRPALRLAAQRGSVP